jgi:hypothetical protein
MALVIAEAVIETVRMMDHIENETEYECLAEDTGV